MGERLRRDVHSPFGYRNLKKCDRHDGDIVLALTKKNAPATNANDGLCPLGRITFRSAIRVETIVSQSFSDDEDAGKT
jgi:hypothetical protein